MDFGRLIQISTVAMDGHVGIAGIMRKHQEKISHLTVVENNNISIAFLIECICDKYHISNGLAKCFTSVGKVAYALL